MLTRRSLLAAPAVLAGARIPAAFAKAPLSGAASPAVHRFKVGAFEVTGISDGTIPLGLELFPAV